MTTFTLWTAFWASMLLVLQMGLVALTAANPPAGLTKECAAATGCASGSMATDDEDASLLQYRQKSALETNATSVVDSLACGGGCSGSTPYCVQAPTAQQGVDDRSCYWCGTEGVTPITYWPCKGEGCSSNCECSATDPNLDLFPCKTCEECVADPNAMQKVSDQDCSACAMGRQTWWPCNLAFTCMCKTAPAPTPPPQPAVDWPFQVVYYWLIRDDKEPVPDAEILRRVTEVVLAFVGTYKFHEPWGPTDYSCEPTCTISDAWPALANAQKYAEQMKAVNPKLKVTVSFGGWNQGPGDKNVNCYKDSGCYNDVQGIADQLIGIVKGAKDVDGIDLDFEETPDLEVTGSAAPEGVQFLLSLDTALQAGLPAGKTVSHAPQPPYFSPAGSGQPGAGGYRMLLEKGSDNIDYIYVQYYNNPGWKIGTDDDAIVNSYWDAAGLVGGGKKTLLGMCFVDCNEGYSAWTPPDGNSNLASSLIEKTMAAGSDFGGFMIWANKFSTKVEPEKHGYVSDIPEWLDGIHASLSQ